MPYLMYAHRPQMCPSKISSGPSFPPVVNNVCGYYRKVENLLSFSFKRINKNKNKLRYLGSSLYIYIIHVSYFQCTSSVYKRSHKVHVISVKYQMMTIL